MSAATAWCVRYSQPQCCKPPTHVAAASLSLSAPTNVRYTSE
jgi:hypothetical protein